MSGVMVLDTQWEGSNCIVQGREDSRIEECVKTYRQRKGGPNIKSKLSWKWGHPPPITAPSILFILIIIITSST